MKTMRFTKLENGYYLASAAFRGVEGGWQTFAELKAFCASEVGDGSKLFAWLVCNGVAHVLSVNVRSLCAPCLCPGATVENKHGVRFSVLSVGKKSAVIQCFNYGDHHKFPLECFTVESGKVRLTYPQDLSRK